MMIAEPDIEDFGLGALEHLGMRTLGWVPAFAGMTTLGGRQYIAASDSVSSIQ